MWYCGQRTRIKSIPSRVSRVLERAYGDRLVLLIEHPFQSSVVGIDRVVFHGVLLCGVTIPCYVFSLCTAPQTVVGSLSASQVLYPSPQPRIITVWLNGIQTTYPPVRALYCRVFSDSISPNCAV